jgi:tRNA-splicing ligase RtcB
VVVAACRHAAARVAHACLTITQYAGHWRNQLGSLGSGNHFIEVTADETGRIWLFLHSGSRGIGNRIATHHISVAQQVMAAQHVELPDRDLAYLTEGTDEFADYLAELVWAQRFAALKDWQRETPPEFRG